MPPPPRRDRPDRAPRRAPQQPRRPQREDGSDRRGRRPPEPQLADDIDPRELDRSARAGLRSLPEDLAERVAKHLVAAGRLIDDDPPLALAHARFARHLAPRLAIIREATGVAAYRNGEYAEALAELRAVRRMTGDASYLAMMADCERGLGRPERALELTGDPAASKLAPAERVELAIVASGARRDLGDYAAAVLALQGPMLDRQEVQPWTVRLWYAYAAALQDAGRNDDAIRWFTSVVAIDDEAETDAEERLQELAGGT